MPWHRLGKGSYNSTYTDSADEASRRFVLKIQKPETGSVQKADSPERAVRLWNLINSDIYPPATLEVVDASEFASHHDDHALQRHTHAWRCPYIKGKTASDREIATAVVDIFNRTGRIIPDASSPGNILRMSNGKLVCVDIGLALELDKRQEETSAGAGAGAGAGDSVGAGPKLRRQKSDVSIESWDHLRQPFNSYFEKTKKSMPHTVATLQALLFIKINRPDIRNADFLLANPKLRAKLADAYVMQRNYLSLKVVHRPPVDIERALLMLESELESGESKTSEAPYEAAEPRAFHAFFSKSMPPLDKLVSDLSVALNENLQEMKEYCQSVLTCYIQTSRQQDRHFDAAGRSMRHAERASVKALVLAINNCSSIEQASTALNELPSSSCEELEITKQWCRIAIRDAKRIESELYEERSKDSDEAKPF